MSGEGEPRYERKTLKLNMGVKEGSIKVDSCIYCGTKNTLTKEHTIPKGLWGTNVILDGSCKHCATLTSKVELLALKHSLDRAREYLGATSRHSKKRGTWNGKTNLENERGENFALPIASVAQFALFPSFPYLPRGLSLEQEREKHQRHDLMIIPLNKAQDLAASGAWGPAFKIDPHVWARFIAKVAYSEYIRVFDTNFRSEKISNFILHGDADKSFFVGGRSGGPKVLYMHNVSFSAFAREGGGFAIVSYVRLLTFAGSPSYLVYLDDIPYGESVPDELPRVTNWNIQSNVWPSYPNDVSLSDFP